MHTLPSRILEGCVCVSVCAFVCVCVCVCLCVSTHNVRLFIFICIYYTKRIHACFIFENPGGMCVYVYICVIYACVYLCIANARQMNMHMYVLHQRIYTYTALENSIGIY